MTSDLNCVKTNCSLIVIWAQCLVLALSLSLYQFLLESCTHLWITQSGGSLLFCLVWLFQPATFGDFLPEHQLFERCLYNSEQCRGVRVNDSRSVFSVSGSADQLCWSASSGCVTLQSHRCHFQFPVSARGSRVEEMIFSSIFFISFVQFEAFFWPLPSGQWGRGRFFRPFFLSSNDIALNTLLV